MIRTVRVPLGDRAYDVVAGDGALEALADAPPGDAFVLFDRAIAPFAARVETVLARDGRRVIAHAVDGDEGLKSWASAGTIYDALAAAGIDRDGLLVAVGGGTVTDAGGFVAATYLRGIRWVAVPTTLLAGVDAAIGGKTGLNVAAGKNLVGAIHQPALVVADVAAFATLDARDRVSGLGEVLKTALVGDALLFEQLERSWRAFLEGSPDALTDAVARCVAVKGALVAADEYDTTGPRAALNFGHTVGHALERVCGYGTLRHGEAVVLGMRVATVLSRTRGHLDGATARRVEGLLRELPVTLPPLDVAAVIGATRSDKKRRGGRVRYVLLRDLGAVVGDDGVEDAEIAAALGEVA